MTPTLEQRIAEIERLYEQRDRVRGASEKYTIDCCDTMPDLLAELRRLQKEKAELKEENEMLRNGNSV